MEEGRKGGREEIEQSSSSASFSSSSCDLADKRERNFSGQLSSLDYFLKRARHLNKHSVRPNAALSFINDNLDKLRSSCRYIRYKNRDFEV